MARKNRFFPSATPRTLLRIVNREKTRMATHLLRMLRMERGVLEKSTPLVLVMRGSRTPTRPRGPTCAPGSKRNGRTEHDNQAALRDAALSGARRDRRS